MRTHQLIELSKLTDSPFNPRARKTDEALQELAASIKARGLLQPLLVRPKNGGFEVVAGHRRKWAIALLNGEKDATPITKISCLIDEDLTDDAAKEMQLIENIQRSSLPPLAEA